MVGATSAASGAQRPFMRKQYRVTKEQVENLSVWNQARGGAFSRSQWEAATSMFQGACANIGAFVAAAVIPSERNAAVASAHRRKICAKAGLFLVSLW